MFNISDYLKKFSKITEDSALLKEVVSKALFEVCGTSEVVFEIKKGTLYIKGSPTLRALIFMNKSRLLERIKQESLKVRIVDIR
jgi:hypothetical protein